MAYALVQAPHTLLRWGMIDLASNVPRTAVDNLIRVLESPDYAWMRQSRYSIVVELQPASGVCKILAHALQTYFRTADVCRGVEPRVFHFMAAHNKLMFDVDIYDQVKPQTHADRKIVSMKVVEKYLDVKSDLYSFYSTRNHKQQTDLADAYIQACRELQTTTTTTTTSSTSTGSATVSCKRPKHRPSRYDAVEEGPVSNDHFDPESVHFI